MSKALGRVRLPALILIACFAAMASFQSVAYATCVTEKEATAKDTCVVIVRQGVPGVWFELSVSEELRKYKLEVPELRFQIGKHADLMEVQKATTELFRLSSIERAQALALSEKAYERALKSEAETKAEASAWYRAPGLWFATGVVVTSVLTVVITKAIDKVDEP